MHISKLKLYRYLSVALAAAAFACMFLGWIEVPPAQREGFQARYGDDETARTHITTLLDTFKIGMERMDVNIFVRYIGTLLEPLADFELTPFELSGAVGNVVKIYKLMQLNTGTLNFLLEINESLLAVSAINAIYRLVFYGTLFYMFWVWARRYYGGNKDHAFITLIGLALLLMAAAAFVVTVNHAFSGSGTALRLRAWPFVAICGYVGSVTLWRIGEKEGFKNDKA